MRFDFLHDAPLESLDVIRAVRVPQRLHTPLAALVTVLLIVATWALLERMWIAQAQAEDVAATSRFEQSRAELDRTRLERTDVERLIVLDKRLRTIRVSGMQVANHLTDLGNHVPDRAWLTEVTGDGATLTIDGRALGLGALSNTIAGLLNSSSAGSSLRLIHATKDQQRSSGGAIAFELRAGPPSP